MGGFIEPSPSIQQRDSNRIPILVGMVLVIVIVGIIALFSRGQSKGSAAPHPYAANLKISDLKMSAAENFVGATVTYLDGMVTNTGDKIVTHVAVHVVFKDSLGQIAQTEDVPLHVLQPGGPYLDAVDLSTSPLAPGQSKPFRLTFEHVTEEWNHEFPELRVMDVSLK